MDDFLWTSIRPSLRLDCVFCIFLLATWDLKDPRGIQSYLKVFQSAFAAQSFLIVRTVCPSHLQAIITPDSNWTRTMRSQLPALQWRMPSQQCWYLSKATYGLWDHFISFRIMWGIEYSEFFSPGLHFWKKLLFSQFSCPFAASIRRCQKDQHSCSPEQTLEQPKT